MSWSNRDKDLENNVNSLFKRRFPRYRCRGIFNSLLEAYLTQWRERITSGYRTRPFQNFLHDTCNQEVLEVSR